MKKNHRCVFLLFVWLVAITPAVVSAATAQQADVDCVICCKATTGGSSNCRVDIERCVVTIYRICLSGKKVFCGSHHWSLVACREDTRPWYEECWEYTGQTCENSMPISIRDYSCDESYINQQCLETLPE